MSLAESGTEGRGGLDREPLWPKRHGEVFEEADLSKDDRGALMRERRQQTHEASPGGSGDVDAPWRERLGRQLEQWCRELAAAESDREPVTGVDGVTAPGRDHLVRNDGHWAACVDESRERTATSWYPDRNRSPQHRAAKRSVRLAEVGVGEEPGLSQDRTRRAHREPEHA